jgi:hypothetical protein
MRALKALTDIGFLTTLRWRPGLDLLEVSPKHWQVAPPGATPGWQETSLNSPKEPRTK